MNKDDIAELSKLSDPELWLVCCSSAEGSDMINEAVGSGCPAGVRIGQRLAYYRGWLGGNNAWAIEKPGW